MNLTKGNNVSIDLGASGDFDPIWLDVKEVEISITVYEDAPPGTHVGSFYVKAGDTRDTTKWPTEVLSSTPLAASGVLIGFRLDLRVAAYGLLLGYTRSSGSGTVQGAVTVKRR